MMTRKMTDRCVMTMTSLLVMQLSYAADVQRLPAQTVERQVVSSTVIAPDSVQASKSETGIEAASRPLIERQVSILKVQRITLDDELRAVQKKVRHVLTHPDDRLALQALAENPSALLRYVERQLFTRTSRVDLRQLIGLVALVLGKQAVQPMLAWGYRLHERADIVQSIIMALHYVPETPLVRQFVNDLLKNELQMPQVIRTALLYHAMFPDESSKHWAVQFRSPAVGAELRYLGVYLSSIVLTDTSLFPVILEMLKQQPPHYQRYYLHLALARVVGAQQYAELRKRLPLAPELDASIHRQLAFDSAVDDQRLTLLSAMLDSGYYEERETALKYLFDHRQSDILSGLLQGPLAARVYRQASDAGIELSPPRTIDAGAHRYPAQSSEINAWRTGLLLAMVLAVMFVAWRLVRRHDTGTSPI